MILFMFVAVVTEQVLQRRPKMTKEEGKMLAFVCVNIMLHNRGGIRTKSPTQIKEKMRLLDKPLIAFRSLDVLSRGNVIMYFEKWKLPVREWLAELEGVTKNG